MRKKHQGTRKETMQGSSNEIFKVYKKSSKELGKKVWKESR